MGDYSATTFDRDNPTHFWTNQEWSAGSLGAREDLWAAQVTEIIFDDHDHNHDHHHGKISVCSSVGSDFFV